MWQRNLALFGGLGKERGDELRNPRRAAFRAFGFLGVMLFDAHAQGEPLSTLLTTVFVRRHTLTHLRRIAYSSLTAFTSTFTFTST